VNKKIFMLLISLLLIGFTFHIGFAQSATSQIWTSGILYLNTSENAGTMTVTYYDGNSSPTSYQSSSISLATNQSGELLIGSVSSIPGTFKGSAVLSSNVPVAVVYEEFVEGSEQNNYDRSFYNGFTSSQADTTFYVPTFQKSAYGLKQTSRVGIQNVDTSTTASVTMEFFNVGETTAFYSDTVSIDPQASYVFSANDISQIAAGFSGSLKLTSNVPIVAAAEETADINRSSYAFEGVASGESKVFIPTMLCSYGTYDQKSYYAVQAVGGTANITVRHYSRDTGLQVGTDYITSIADGAKATLRTCVEGAAPAGSIGSSVIESTGGDIIVIVKVIGTIGDLRTAYVATGTGAQTVALPYIVWSSDHSAGFRSYVAVQNIGTSDAVDVTAKYYNAAGTLQTTHVLADSGSSLGVLQKANTWTNIAGLGSGDFSGSVIIESDQPVLVTVRLTKLTPHLSGEGTEQFGEDYTGIPLP